MVHHCICALARKNDVHDVVSKGRKCFVWAKTFIGHNYFFRLFLWRPRHKTKIVPSHAQQSDAYFSLLGSAKSEQFVGVQARREAEVEEGL